MYNCYNGLPAYLTHGFLIIDACFKICLNSLLGKGWSNTVNASFSLIGVVFSFTVILIVNVKMHVS